MDTLIKKIPEDMDTLRATYEGKNPREGTCGPTLIAFLTNRSVKDIIDNWSINYQGYCSFRELEREINKYGIETERIHAPNKFDWVLPNGVDKAIARIQWKKKYSNWAIPEKNTHFVYLEEIEGQVHLFDNTEGWFEVGSPVAKDYMVKGKITSFIAIKGKEAN